MRILARSIARALPNWSMPLVRRLYCLYEGIGDGRFKRRTGFAFLPPSELRFHVGSVGREEYVRIGKQSVEDVDKALLGVHRNWNTFQRLLDFGCGSGRTVVWLRDKGPRIFGCDIHDACIRWCRGELGFGEFSVNQPTPPLIFPGSHFDLILSFSVFTHLDEGGQNAWLKELARVTGAGGILLLSTHGPASWNRLSSDEVSVIDNRGILVKEAHALWGTFSEYFNTYHSEEYVRREWGRFFDVLDYVPQGLNKHQDLVVLQKTN